MKKRIGIVMVAAMIASLGLSVPAMAQTKSKTQTRTMTSIPTQSKKGNVNQTGTATSNYGLTTPGPVSKRQVAKHDRCKDGVKLPPLCLSLEERMH
jgi:hypothetical protein